MCAHTSANNSPLIGVNTPRGSLPFWPLLVTIEFYQKPTLTKNGKISCYLLLADVDLKLIKVFWGSLNNDSI